MSDLIERLKRLSARLTYQRSENSAFSDSLTIDDAIAAIQNARSAALEEAAKVADERGKQRHCVAKEPYMMVIARSSGDKQRAPVGHPGALGQLSVMMANASMTVLCCLGQPDLAPQWQNHTSFQP